MKLRKRVMALVLSLAMIATYSMPVLAEEGADLSSVWTAEDFTYGEFDTSTGIDPVKLYPADSQSNYIQLEPYLVTGFSESGLSKLETNTDLVIPDKDPSGRQVTGVGQGAFSGKGLTSVAFPEGVMSDIESSISSFAGDGVTRRGNFIILSTAFSNNQLEEVILPEGVIAVRNSAFTKNPELKYVSIPHTVWVISQGAFGNCGIEQVYFDDHNDFGLEFDSTSFSQNSIKALQLPLEVRKLDRYAFIGNTGLEELSPDAGKPYTNFADSGVVYLYADESLRNASLIYHLENSSKKSFSQKLITDETIPDEYRITPEDYMSGKPHDDPDPDDPDPDDPDPDDGWTDEDFTYDETGSVVTGFSESGEIRLSESTDIVLPSEHGGLAVTGVADSAFNERSEITGVTFPASITEIGEMAFRSTGLEEVYLPDSVTSVGGGAFAMTWNVSSIRLSGSLEIIPDGMFNRTKELQEDKYDYHPLVDEIVIPQGVTYIGKSAFSGLGAKSVVIPDSVETIEQMAFSNNLFTEVEIPGSVKLIRKGAFAVGMHVFADENRPVLSSLILHEGLEEIRDKAFENSAVETVMIPSTVKALAADTFINNHDGGSTQGTILVISVEQRSAQGEYSGFSAEGDGHTSRATVTFDPCDPCGGSVTPAKMSTNNDYRLDSFPEASNIDDKVELEGWYTSKTGGSRASLNDTYYKNTTLYARWKTREEPADEEWNAEDFTYAPLAGTDPEDVGGKYLYGCDYSRSFTVSGKAISGFSEKGLAKLEHNKDLVLPSQDPDGNVLVGVNRDAFKEMGLTSVTFPDAMMVDYDDTVTHTVTRRGNFVISDSAFAKNELTEVDLPEGVIAVLPNAFQDNRIETVTLPHTIWWIETMAFARNRITTVNFPASTDFRMEMHGMSFADNQIRSVRLPDYTEVVNMYIFMLNPGMEPIPESEYTKYPSKRDAFDKSGLVYMYTDNEDLLNKDRIHTIDRTAPSQHSSFQKLILGSAPDEGGWTVSDFTFSGTAITGLSESGIAKRAENPELVLPDKNSSGDYITAIADAPANPGGLFATAEEKFTSVELPARIRTIGANAFRDSGITKVKEFPSTLTTIGTSAFQQCMLETVSLPDSLTSLGPGAFATNPKLKKIILSKNLKEIPAAAFGCSDAVNYMTGLTALTIPEGVTKIGQRAFAGNNIHNIVIPESVTEIGEFAFSTKNYLRDPCTLTLNEGLVTIGRDAFRNKVISEVQLPTTVTGLPDTVFRKEYSIDDSTETGKDPAPVAKTVVYVTPEQKADTDNFPRSEFHRLVVKGDDVWNEEDFTYEEFDVSATDETRLCSRNNPDTENNCVTLKPYLVTGFSETGLEKLENNKNLVIPATDEEGRQITGIGKGAFKNMGLKSVTLPDGIMCPVEDQLKPEVDEGVTTRGNLIIMNTAFYGNELTEVSLPDDVIWIQMNAFANNASLQSVSLGKSVWRIDQGAFGRCAINTVEFNADPLFAAELDTMAFYGNNIKAVQLPRKLGKVEKYAFNGNPGLEPIDSSSMTDAEKRAYGVDGENEYGMVYMYGFTEHENVKCIMHIDNEIAGSKSYSQKLITGESMPDKYGSWSAADFEYSLHGTIITGLSESGEYKATLFKVMKMPARSSEGTVVTGIADGPVEGLFRPEGSVYTSVILPENLETIGDNAFRESGLISLDLPDTVREIGVSSFTGNDLKDIILPDSLVKAGNGAFSSNGNLSSVKLSASMKEIPASMFLNNVTADNFVSIDIPEGVTTIGARAFSGHQFTSIVLPSTVKAIGDYAFGQEADRGTLSSITLNDGLESIGSTVFRNSVLDTVEIPESLTTLDKDAFRLIPGKVTVYSGNREQAAGEGMYSGIVTEGSNHKVVYSNLTRSGWDYSDFEFDGHTVTGWSEAGNLTRMDNKSLVVPDLNPETGELITEIGDEAFKIPDSEISVTSLGTESPNGMKTVVIPAGVTRIGDKAFEYNRLNKVSFPEVLEYIGTSAFHGNTLTEISLPDSLTAAGDGVFAENNITEAKLSQNMRVIPQGFMSMNIRMDHIEIPECVSEIGDMAFAGARLETLDIPSNVTSIGRKAFHLHHLKELTVPGNVRTIGESAFEGTFKAITLEKLTLGEGVETIGSKAFKEAYLSEVVLPRSLRSLASDAFMNNSGKDDTAIVVCYVSSREQMEILGTGDTWVLEDKSLREYISEKTAVLTDNSDIANVAASELNAVKKLQDEAVKKLAAAATLEEAQAIFAEYSVKIDNRKTEARILTEVQKAEKAAAAAEKSAADAVAALKDAKSAAEAEKSAAEAAAALKKAKAASKSDKAKINSLERKLVKLVSPRSVKIKRAGKKKVKLSWKSPKELKLKGYRIYRSVRKKSGYKRVATTGKTSIVIKKGLKKNKTYYFKIRGYRKVNGKTVWSKYSKVVKIKVK